MNTRLDFNFPVPTKLYFGAGKLGMLHTLEMPGNKALVVISNGKSTHANGYLDRTLKELALANVETIVYDKVMPNPTKECIEEGASIARENATKPVDFIDALMALEKACDVDNLKMSDYGITPDEFDDMAENAIHVMARLSTQDIQPLTHDEIVNILKESYR